MKLIETRTRVRAATILMLIVGWLAPVPSVAAEEKRQDGPVYTHAAGQNLLLKNHPELVELRARDAALRGARRSAGLLLQKNPELEFSALRGRRTESRQILSSEPYLFREGGADIVGWEAGLRQELEIAGEPGRRRLLADANLIEHAARLKARERQLLAEYTERFFAVRLNGLLAEHLSESLDRLRSLIRRLGPGYRDPRLGRSVRKAMHSNLLHLEVGYENARAAYESNVVWICGALGIGENAVCTLSPRPGRLRALLDTRGLASSDELTARARANNPELARYRATLAAARARESLRRRERYPAPALFGFVGEDRAGTFRAIDLDGTSEANRYLRVGLSIPLPLWNRNQGELQGDRARVEAASRVLRTESATLGHRIRSEREIFLRSARLSIRLERQMANAEGEERRLARALLAGRISYFEFWSEHDRHHELLREYVATALSALRSRGRLERLLGGPLTGDAE